MTTTKLRACLQCRGETHPGTIEQATGEDHSLAVTLHGMPVLECGKGHRQFVDAGFALPVLDRLLEEQCKLPAGRERRKLLFKHFYCHDCGAELQDAHEQQTLNVDLEVSGSPPFRADVSLPLYKCPQCGRKQLHSAEEVTSRTPVALAHAFHAAGIPHG